MDSGHETLLDSELIVDDLGHGCKTVGGARGVGDNIHVRLVGLFVDSHNEHGSIARRSRDDDLGSTTLHVSRSRLSAGEDTGRLNNVISTGRTPVDVSRVTLAKDLNGLVSDGDGVGLGIVRDGLGNASVHCIISVHVLHVVDRDEGVVDGNDVDVGLVRSGPHYEATNTSESIDTDIDAHISSAVLVLVGEIDEDSSYPTKMCD
mmetsp:Transcript_9478/g.14257  ORF Transcript_9478/g.14257 Transcript_9478/m.14257 type:complete len:205 (-) Transcript_9478:34-648(-)